MPSRARSGCPLGISHQLAVEGVGDLALETPQRLEGLLALGSFAPVVGPAVGVEADLADRGDVDHVVHPAVAGPGQAVAVLLAGGCVQGCGAGPGREAVAVGESRDVTGVGQDPCGHDGSHTVEVHQV